MAVRNIRRPAEQHASRANFVAQLLRNILYGEICDVSRYLPPAPGHPHTYSTLLEEYTFLLSNDCTNLQS